MTIAEQLPRLKLLLGSEADKYTDDFLALQLELAAEAINNRRCYNPTTTRPIEERYSNLLLQLTISAINKIGAEGEVAHNENSINRNYGSDSIYPTALLKTIVPRVGLK